jgi:hypothetical protein
MSTTEHGCRFAELLTMQTNCFGRKTSPIRPVRASEECKIGTVPRSTSGAIFVERPTKATWLAILVAVILAPAEARPQQIDPEGRTMLGQAQKAVAAYHAGAPRSHSMLRVVYFVPAGIEPLPAYAERLDRVVNDVSNFIRDGLRRFGLQSEGLTLERKGGKVRLHLVRGKLPADQYHHSSGDVAKAEIRAALEDTFDLDREHVLVFYALCRKERDGRYVFDAPYYGRGSERNGLCHAADCEWLDPALLHKTGKSIVYTEHYYPRVEESVAEFNSKYLGGTAHELAHCLGLPHDEGGLSERRFGVSLMGHGNLNYRREVWGGGRPAYVARASALKLISHPLITGSNRGRWESADGSFESLRFSGRGHALRVEGKVTGKVSSYAVVAYAWPTLSKSDHGAGTYPVILKDDGSFALDVSELPPDAYHLKLIGFHVNGSATTVEFPITIDAAGKPDTLGLSSAWLVDAAENAVMKRQPQARRLLSEQALSAALTPEAKRKLRVLRAVLDPPSPIDLSVNIASVKQLELRTEGAEGHNHNSWAIWVEPSVER